MLDLLAKALLATVVIEELAALCVQGGLTLRGKRLPWTVFLVVFWANALTNPIINLVCWFMPDSLMSRQLFYVSLVVFLELCVLAVETLIFYRFGRVRPLTWAFFFAFILNVASYFSATWLEKFGYWDWNIF